MYAYMIYVCRLIPNEFLDQIGPLLGAAMWVQEMVLGQTKEAMGLTSLTTCCTTMVNFKFKL